MTMGVPMTTRLRPRLAALLLASIGAILVAAPPAFAQYGQRWNVPAAAAPAIERFVLRSSTGRIEPGSELEFRLVGTAGAEAWVDVPGVTSGVPLAEVRPGVYEGSYVVRRRDDLDAFGRATATLQSGWQQAIAHVDIRGERRQARDDRPPQITHLSPGNNDRIEEGARAGIAARLSDEGSGIDPASVRVRLGGRDVTGQSHITADEVSFRADLRPGRYTAEVTARDRAGNSAAKSWNFEVVARRGEAAPRRDTAPPLVLPVPGLSGPLGLQVTSHAHNAVVNAAENVRLEGQTAPHAKVRVLVDTLVPTGGSALAVQKVLDLEVQADAGGHFYVDFSPSGYVVPGVRYDVRLISTYGNRAVEQRLSLQRRAG